MNTFQKEWYNYACKGQIHARKHDTNLEYALLTHLYVYMAMVQVKVCLWQRMPCVVSIKVATATKCG